MPASTDEGKVCCDSLTANGTLCVLAAGQGCVAGDDNCDGGFCSAAGKCQLLGVRGDACALDEQCASSLCRVWGGAADLRCCNQTTADGTACLTKPGETCSATPQCQGEGDFVCTGGVCRAAKGQPGDACDDDGSCASGVCGVRGDANVTACCAGAGLMGDDNQTLCRVGVNQSCVADAQCADSGAVCSAATGVCVVPKQEDGEPCSDGFECLGGACGRWDTAATLCCSSTDADGNCQLDLGDACQLDSQCWASGHFCDSGACQPQVELGEACDRSAMCGQGHCAPNNNTCQPAPEGIKCRNIDDCEEPLACVFFEADTRRCCLEILGEFCAVSVGQPCTHNAQCIKSFCDDSTSPPTCQDLLANNQPCTANETCKSQVCDAASDTCRPSKAVGAACEVIKRKK